MTDVAKAVMGRGRKLVGAKKVGNGIMPSSGKLSYEEAAKLLSILDMSKGQNIDLVLAGVRLQVDCWVSDAGPPSPPDNAREIEERDVGPASGQAREAGSDGLGSAEVGVRAPNVGVFRSDLAGRLSGAGKREIAVGLEERVGEIVSRHGEATPVVSPIAGALVDLCVTDGEFVAYGQTIAVVVPAAAHSGSPHGR